MNPYQIYQTTSANTMPLNIQLSQIHRRGALLTKQVKEYAEAGNIQDARTNIIELEDMITFLRSSLNPTFDVSSRVDETYFFYYKVVANWYIDPTKIPTEYDALVEFWESWSQTWAKVPAN